MVMLSLSEWNSLIDDRILHYTQTNSTNCEAFAAADKDAPTGTWILADQQFSGKGRSGREWISLLGNLHASLLLTNVQKPLKIPELSIVAGVAFHQALIESCNHSLTELCELKWPNDILLNKSKIGGILIESTLHSQNQNATVVIGFGLNLAAHPEIVNQPATNLSIYGLAIKPSDFLKKLDQTLYRWVGVWSEDEGLNRIKKEWLDRSLPLGTSLVTKGVKGAITGIFVGINNDGHLLLQNRNYKLETITFGDVSIENDAPPL